MSVLSPQPLKDWTQSKHSGRECCMSGVDTVDGFFEFGGRDVLHYSLSSEDCS